MGGWDMGGWALRMTTAGKVAGGKVVIAMRLPCDCHVIASKVRRGCRARVSRHLVFRHVGVARTLRRFAQLLRPTSVVGEHLAVQRAHRVLSQRACSDVGDEDDEMLFLVAH